nr:MBL fold metallo-hydrolase [Acetobacter garciniae]
MNTRARRYTEDAPEYGRLLRESRGVARIVAPNPGPMTYHGTNTWLVETDEGCVVIDPGPDDPAHQRAVLAGAGGQVRAIVVTHGHADHERGAPALARLADAPILGGSHGPALVDQSTVCGLRVIATPGHTMDHICLDIGENRLIAGDHIMGWSSSVVMRAPHGSMDAYLTSLKTIHEKHYALVLSGHGPPITEPHPFIEGLIRARQRRLAQIHAMLGPDWQSEATLLERIYKNLAAPLRPAATEVLGATLEALQTRGQAVRNADGAWRKA